MFRDVYNVKRVQAGVLRGSIKNCNIQIIHHDCPQLGRGRGSALIDLETHQVLGIHVCGRYLENGVAVPVWLLRNDPLFQRADICFADPAKPNHKEETFNKLECLAGSRFWADAQAAIINLYQRAMREKEGAKRI